MFRVILLTLLAVLLLATAPAHTSPVIGQYREAYTRGQKKTKVEPGRTYSFKETFFGNERACTILMGDRNPKMNLTVKVFDRIGQLVVEDSGGDFLAVIWYPPRTEEYTITISHDHATVYNEVDVVVK
jgi:hypothetical protein